MEMEIGRPSSDIEFQYTDKELDTNTNLYYFHARYRDPMDNRFYGRDRVHLEDNLKNYFGINPYVFVRNNPIKSTDPDGKNPYSSSEMYMRYVFEYGMHTTPEQFAHEMPKGVATAVYTDAKEGLKAIPDIALTGAGIMATLADAPVVAGAITVVSVAKTGVEMMDGDISPARGLGNGVMDVASEFVKNKPYSIAIDVASYVGNNVLDNMSDSSPMPNTTIR